MAVRTSDTQSIQAHRSSRHYFVACAAVYDSISFSLWLCQTSTRRSSRSSQSSSRHDLGSCGRTGNEHRSCCSRRPVVPLGQLPSEYRWPWVAENLKNALLTNVFLAIFNLLPLPPLDGGRIAVGLLPDKLAMPLARLEPYGLPLLIGVLFILPILGAQLGINLSIVSRFVAGATHAVIRVMLALTGNT